MSQLDYVKTRREDVDAIPADRIGTIRFFLKLYTRLNILVFKLSKGRLWKSFPGGYPICVVGTKGRKTGARREIALIHLPYEDGILMVASQGGMDVHPAWYHNVLAHPEVDVLVGGERRKLRARLVEADEKRALWPHLLSLYPDFDEYQARTDRDIPVFDCQPRGRRGIPVPCAHLP